MLDKDILRCPCSEKTLLIKSDDKYLCIGENCIHNGLKNAFPNTNHSKPVLISNERCDTIIDPSVSFSQVRRLSKFMITIKNLINRKNKLSYNNAVLFVKNLDKINKKKRVLIIGGATKGTGTNILFDNDHIDKISCDVYETEHVDVLCDAHYLPFASSSFDGVWIQAVLEHVVEPTVVVEEIFRVLKKDGIVYAETPFLQQVHEGLYDFTRFTVLGHRYLFRKFENIKCGVLDGPGDVLLWNIRYIIWGITRLKKVAQIVGVIFIPLSIILNLIIPKKFRYDNSSGVFFLGKKNTIKKLRHSDLKKYYRGVIK